MFGVGTQSRPRGDATDPHRMATSLDIGYSLVSDTALIQDLASIPHYVTMMTVLYILDGSLHTHCRTSAISTEVVPFLKYESRKWQAENRTVD